MRPPKKKDYRDRVAECYTRYGTKLFRIIDKKIHNAHISEELLHDLFLKIYKNQKDIDPSKEHTEIYLITAAINLVRDYFRRNSFELNNIVHNDLELIDDELYPTVDVENIYIEGEVISTLFDIINRFPKKERKILWRYHFLHHRVSHIAKDFNTSEYKIKKILQKMYNLIRDELSDFFA
ncbi:MAG: sigma-70 family RNA polymerase sigma factor [Spirochaetes bacterium]|nr:sigma-70 family RNA polymerase sigma factor [Spirochaetota bacterium]